MLARDTNHYNRVSGSRLCCKALFFILWLNSLSKLFFGNPNSRHMYSLKKGNICLSIDTLTAVSSALLEMGLTLEGRFSPTTCITVQSG